MNNPPALLILTKRHRLFVEAYAGDVITAMLAAGFQGVPAYLKEQGEMLMQNSGIQEAIKERSRYMAKTFHIIADRDERMAFLTSTMRNEDPHVKEEKDANGLPIPQGNIAFQNRLKAAELLGKANGDFIENINLSGNISLVDLITKSYDVKESIEEIEAEYYKVEEEKKIEAPTSDLSSFI